jgi:mannan endo-1,4-beta-mannosidase
MKTFALSLLSLVTALTTVGCSSGNSHNSSASSNGQGGSSGLAGAGGTITENAAGAAGASSGNDGAHVGFWVDGQTLRDRCGEPVVLRGVSEMVTWSAAKDGTPYFAEIAKTGANVVRIVWTAKDSAAKLDAALGNAIAEQLIPMPEIHDATGDMSKLPACVDYWVSPDVVAVLQKYEDKLLINIANEVGNGTVAKEDWIAAYTEAVARMRSVGIHAPLIIDAPSWGQDINMLQAAGPAVIAADPEKNLLFSVHMWWNDPSGRRITDELTESVALKLPLIVGEFAQHNFSGCSSQPLDYKTLLALSRTLEIGWLAWSWGGVKNNDCANDQPFDMAPGGSFANLSGWGLEVAVTDPNSIKETSVRPRYMLTGSCN